MIEDIINIIYLRFWRKVDAINILSAKIVRYPMGSLGKVHYVPSEVKANCSLEAVEIGTE